MRTKKLGCPKKKNKKEKSCCLMSGEGVLRIPVSLIDGAERDMLDESTIRSAVAGDIEALMQVVDYYEPYIDRYAVRRRVDMFGNIKEEIDLDVKISLQLALMVAVTNFEFR